MNKMSRRVGDRFSGRKMSSLRQKFSWSRERKTTQSLKVRSTHVSGKKLKSKLNTSLPDISSSGIGTKFNLYKEGDVQVHILKEGSTNVFTEFAQHLGAIKQWESHHILITNDEIVSESTGHMLNLPITYSSIERASGFDLAKGSGTCVKVVTPSCTYLLQTPDGYQRDKLLCSLKWKMKVYKSRKILYGSTQPDLMLAELQSLVTLTLNCPIYIDDTHTILLDIVSQLLTQQSDNLESDCRESLISSLAPLVERNQPSLEICTFFIKHCRQSPRSVAVVSMFTPIVQQILKHSVDFGKSTYLRTFIMEYIQALNSQNNALDAVRTFIRNVHGPMSQCPHPRILNNLVAVCLSAVYQCFSSGNEEESYSEKVTYPWKSKRSQRRANLMAVHRGAIVTEKNVLNNQKVVSSNSGDARNMKNSWQESKNKQMNDSKPLNTDINKRGDVNLVGNYPPKDKRLIKAELTRKPSGISAQELNCVQLFIEVLLEISKIPDWCPGLAGVLQPLPFPDEAMKCKEFIRLIYPVIECFADDDREKVVTCLLSTREGKEGWIQVFSPGGAMCEDDGALFSKIVQALSKPGIQAGKMKKFLMMLASTQLQVIILLALRENEVMIKVLRDMLQYGSITKEQEQLQAISALRCTTRGNTAYEDLRSLLAVFNKTDGPKEFTLAPNSTDDDLRTLLSAGSLGNLEKLDLSFTHVSSDVVDLLIRLPNLQHLNLWSTNFDDSGLQVLCDYVNLQSLNLCETRVTDEGIDCLEVMTNLRILNLNSTRVSEDMSLRLRKILPNLRECDVTYTEAWWPQA